MKPEHCAEHFELQNMDCDEYICINSQINIGMQGKRYQ